MKSKFFEVVLGAGIVVFIASAFAYTWTQTNTPTNDSYLGLAVSPDGRILCAIGSSGRPIMSTDGGQTWATNAPASGYSAIACSADGKTLIATLVTNGITINISTNSGTNWFPSGLPAGDWRAVTASADGSKLCAAMNNGYIYNSTNFGANWQLSDSPQAFWQSMAASADGTRLAAAASDAGVFVSFDSGATWGGVDMFDNFVASSADGNRLVAGGNFGICISTNGGGDWTSTGVKGGAVASSADGLRLAALDQSSNDILISTNGGATWQTNTPFFHAYRIASSADGNKLFVTVPYGPGAGVCIGTNVPDSPQFTFSVANGTAHFDWPVPSTGFVVQQNVDLSTTNWVAVTNPPVLNPVNLHQQLALPVSGVGFFRLGTP